MQCLRSDDNISLDIKSFATEGVGTKTFRRTNGHSFFWESAFILSKKYKIKEIPIFLPGRNSGSSKMRIKDILSAFLYLIYFTFIGRFKI